MKYIIEIENTPFGNPERDLKLYKCAQFKSLVFDAEGLSRLTPYTEPDCKAIEDAQNQGWKFANDIINGLNIDERRECFGYGLLPDILNSMSYQEAVEHFEIWKTKRNDLIKVGDEVRSKATGRIGFVSHIGRSGVNVVWGIGGTGFYGYNKLEKTGRHYPQVVEILKNIEGAE